MSKHIGIQKVKSGLGSAGVGFVVVPEGIDRKMYIENCYRTNTISINGGRGYGYFNNVNVDSLAMQNIHFPVDEDNRGTPVVWVLDAVSQLPVVVGVLRKRENYYSLSENQLRVERNQDGRSVDIFVDGNTSSLNVNMIGDELEPADLNIKLSSTNKESVININCDNEINITAEKAVKVVSNQEVDFQIKDKGEVKALFNYKLGRGFVYSDEFDNSVNCVEGEVSVVSKKINHNSGKEPMVLGETLTGILNDLLTAIQKITVISPVGSTSVPVNIADFASIQGKLNTIKSQISNLE